MLTLGIETSCDETAVALVEDGKRVLSSVVSSSVHLHKRYGGIVPEIACRYHVEYIGQALREALRKAGVSADGVDLVAVTRGPGLVGALLVGISMAKSLSQAKGRPLVGVNHLKAHIWVAKMVSPSLRLPFIGLIVSGGHTALVHVKDPLKIVLLGQTRDDAVGEAFDKVAKILGLGFPGGPAIEKEARLGDPRAVKFSRPIMERESLDFSFSGIKTAVLYYVRERGNFRNGRRPDIAAGFQEACVDALVEKSILACKSRKTKRLAVGGGVSANSRLRKKLEEACGKEGINVYFPPMELSLDNAVMTAGLGHELYRRGRRDDLTLTAEPNMEW